MFKRLKNYLFGKPETPNLWPDPLPQHRWHVSYTASINGERVFGHFQMSRPSEDFEANHFRQDSIDFALERAAKTIQERHENGRYATTRDIIILGVSYLGWMTDAEFNP